MSDERKPVVCRCGEEMHFVVIERETRCGEAPWFGYYTCDCGWMAPSREGDTTEDCERNAYAAATQRPPNLPLTREQVEAMDDLDAVWVVRGRGDAYTVMVVEAMRLEHVYTNGEVMFGHRPTPADIESARKEHQ